MTKLAEAEAIAYRASVCDSPAQMARWCLDNLGQRVITAGLGSHSSPVRRYARHQGKPSGDREAARLRLLYRGTDAPLTYTAQTARAFLRSSNPLLGDHAPLDSHRGGASRSGRAEVLTAMELLQ